MKSRPDKNPGLPTLDREVAERLYRMPSPSHKTLLHEMAELFHRNYGGRLENVRSKLGQAQFEAASRDAHLLKSSISYLGASQMADLCQRLEKMCFDGKTAAALAMLNTVQVEYDLFVTEIQAVYTDLKIA